MIAWLDIASPSLHLSVEAWIACRGTKLLPPATAYPDFAAGQPAKTSTCLAIPKGDSSPAYLFVGAKLKNLLKGCASGTHIDQILPPATRLALTSALYGVVNNRGPVSGRGTLPGSTPQNLQWVLLPFGSESRVRLVHTVYDLL